MIEQKRASLERFIYEQVIGPGISGYRFLSLQQEKLFDHDLQHREPLQYTEEILNIVPAGVYSSAILFPVNKPKDDEIAGAVNGQAKETVLDEEGNEISGDDNDDEDEAIAIDQMYPNTIGLTCSLSDMIVNTKDISIVVEGRYYTKINIRSPHYHMTYGVLCECDVKALTDFITDTVLAQYISVHKKGENNVLLIQKVAKEVLGQMKKTVKEKTEWYYDVIKQDVSTFDFEMKVKNLSGLKQACYFAMKNEVTDPQQIAHLYTVTQKAEVIESIVDHLSDLIELGGSGSYGLWQSNPLCVEVQLPEEVPSDISGKKVYLYKDFPSLKDVYIHDLGNATKAALSMNLQFSRDSRKTDRKIFLKAQLVNTSTPYKPKEGDSRYFSAFNEQVNTRCFFGVRIRISSSHLMSYNELELNGDKKIFEEDDVTRFIYRQYDNYGIGHGCSVKWYIDPQRGLTICTEYIPQCDTPDVDHTPRDKTVISEEGGLFMPRPYLESSKALEFKWLSTFSSSNDAEVIEELYRFANSYGDWITAKRLAYRDQPKNVHGIAEQELQKCENDLNRIKGNIQELLEGKPNKGNLLSFRLMNSAMFMQLWHSINVRSGKVEGYFDATFSGFTSDFYVAASDGPVTGNKLAWRPFQLAFILLNLDGIFKKPSDPGWKMRNELVDLVWFPTGGGKTEAYLGIIALTIINRRTVHKELGGGTAAIMRYTLRLLTLQQFQRATLMIMALELTRRWGKYNLGDKEPIFIGLWVGENSLPNSLDDLGFEFKKLVEGLQSKVPHESCPWCGSKLSPANQKVAEQNKTYYYNRWLLSCSNINCSFSYLRAGRIRTDQGPIPVSLCDEEIYQHPPALLFATVDKFAQLAHKVSSDERSRHMDSRRLFGKGNWESGKPKSGYGPPDLIIQDELHLLLGPLGSSVALFESAVDQLCTSNDGTRPKVISSTATTRNTDLQIIALFDRRVNIFPKPGVECDDSFFTFYKRTFSNASSDSSTYISKRRYMGVLPTGRTQIWMQMRLASILLTHRALFELEQLQDRSILDYKCYQGFEKAMDHYHTVISYFNSLKEVGKTESQVHSYISKEIRRVFNRVIRPKKMMHAFYTHNIHKSELTGRLSGEEVKNELQKVQTKWNASGRLMHEHKGELVMGRTPPDFVVATNMISVGIDVSRFNTILINSMPRNIAEYIQASSRVARESLGLVLTIHHPFRSRDVSHYERFIEFHEKMYSYVEPISITPFTQKSVDRYMALYLATMVRHTTKKFVDRGAADSINELSEVEVAKLVNHISSYFDKRRQHLALISSNERILSLLTEKNVDYITDWIQGSINSWRARAEQLRSINMALVFNNKRKVTPPKPQQEDLYVSIDEYGTNVHDEKWQIPNSLRVIEPAAALKIKLK